MKTFDTTEDECPHCKVKLECASPINGHEGPGEGDLSVCFSCGTLLAFTKDLKHRLLAPGEIDTLSYEERRMLLGAQQLIKERAIN